MLKTRRIAVSTTPTVLASSTVAANSTAAMSLAGASITDVIPILIRSDSTQNVYLGHSDMTTVTTALGMPFAGPDYTVYHLMASDPLFAMTTNAEVTLIVQGGRQTI